MNMLMGSRPAGTGLAVVGAVVAMLLAPHARAGEPPRDKAWAAFLDEYVVETGRGATAVRYGAVSDEDHAALKHYIAEAADAGAPLGADDAFAYWTNLYNALTVDIVLDHYPVASIRDIRFGLRLQPGPWREKLVTVSGRALSLDDIEHRILRADWDEPRVHFAVNCASTGCPALRRQPFDGDRLDDQLDAAARDFVNSGRAVWRDGDRLVASSIFDWYGTDFADSEAGILAYLGTYAEPPLAAVLAGAGGIDSYDYDWALNAAEQTRD